MSLTPSLDQQIHEDVRNYYGEELSSSNDLKTSACCSAEAIPKPYRGLVDMIHPEILDKFYGCGSPLPFALEGIHALDLGCGSGRDSYMLSALCGPTGKVYGVDMTEAQLEVARRHREEQAARFGFPSNVSFLHGQIEDLAALGIEDNSLDLVVSNCVINLSPHKERVFAEIFRVLKPGGELYFSDIFADRRIPQALTLDPELRGECLSGAMYIQDFRRMQAQQGIHDYRIVSNQKLDIHNEAIEARIGMVGFRSMTVRAFKLDLEDRCENYGQVARYRGTIQHHPHRFVLDDHHLFETGLPVPVCGNTAAMLQETRYGSHFEISGDTSTHFGLFDCEPTVTMPLGGSGDPGVACC